MNTKQRDTWWELVHQCEIQCAKPYYSSINVASAVRSEAIVAAGTLVELVTPELAELLEHLATYADLGYAPGFTPPSPKHARATATLIREALALEGDDAKR